MARLVLVLTLAALAATLVAQEPLTATAAQELANERRHRLTDAEFARIATAVDATELDLSHLKGVSPGAMRQLHGMQRLERLALRDVGRFARGVRHLAALPALRSLDVSQNREWDAAGVGALTALEELVLNGCKAIGDDELRELETLTNLHTLRLYGCHKVTDAGFNRLFAKLTRIHTLELAFCWWHEGRELVLPPNLVHLDLHESKRLVDAAIIDLRNKQGLRTLNLFQCLVLTDRALAALAGLDELEWLDVGSIRALTDEGLAHVGTLTGLRHLSLCDNANFTGAGIAQLAELTELRILNLWHCESIDDRALTAMRAMRELQQLTLSSCANIGDVGLGHLAGLPALQKLHLDGCLGVTGKGLLALSELPLTELTLRRCHQLRDADLAPLHAMAGLRFLDLRDCPELTAGAITALRRKLSGCRIRP